MQKEGMKKAINILTVLCTAAKVSFKFVVICSFFALNGKINYANIVNDVNKTC